MLLWFTLFHPLFGTLNRGMFYRGGSTSLVSGNGIRVPFFHSLSSFGFLPLWVFLLGAAVGQIKGCPKLYFFWLYYWGGSQQGTHPSKNIFLLKPPYRVGGGKYTPGRKNWGAKIIFPSGERRGTNTFFTRRKFILTRGRPAKKIF